MHLTLMLLSVVFSKNKQAAPLSTVKAMLKAGCLMDVVDSKGFSVLHVAARGGNAEVIRELLSAGCDINATNNDGGTPLHVAACQGKTEAALELIEHGAEKAIVAGTIGTPLHQAAFRGHASTVKELLKAGCLVDVVNSNGCSVLHAAAAGGSVEVIREMLSAGCDINATDNDGETPLHVAAWNGKTEAALELIGRGAEKAIVAGARGTPLHQAALGGHASTVKELLKTGCPVDVVDRNAFSVLHAAAQGGNVEVIREMLSAGCDINATDNDGGTTLHVAALNGKTEATLEFIRLGAEKAIVVDEIGTPLHQAAFGNHASTVKELLKAGCPVDVVDSNGFSVLHAAAQGGNAEVIRELLSAGCDINATDNGGETPLHVAAGEGKTEATLEIVRLGAEKAIVAGARGTPLHEAAFGGHASTVQAMLKAGCPVDVVDSNGFSVLHAAANSGNVEVIREVLGKGLHINATHSDGKAPVHVSAAEGKTEAALELIRHGGSNVAYIRSAPVHQASNVGSTEVLVERMRCGATGYCGVNCTGVLGLTPLHWAVLSENKDCVRVLLEHGADPKKAGLYVGSPYVMATIVAPTVVEAFDDFIVEEEDESLPWMHEISKDHRWSRFIHDNLLDRYSAFERDTFGMSRLEYMLVVKCNIDTLVSCFQKLSVAFRFYNEPLASVDNVLLLATIIGMKSIVKHLLSLDTCRPTFAAQRVTSLLKMHYSLLPLPQIQELVPLDTIDLNLLHVAVLAMKFRASAKFLINDVESDHPSLLKLLVTNDSFRHTLHEYIGSLTPLDLAEKLGLDEAVTIISGAGGRHGIWTVIPEEVRFEHGPAILHHHQGLLQLMSSGPHGQQAVQAVVSELLARTTTAEQGTSTEESHLLQQKMLDQRPDMCMISKYFMGQVSIERWRRLGLSLNIPPETLSLISSSHSSYEDRYLEVLIYWLEHNEAASWRTLLEVLSHFETKQTMDQFTEILATQGSAVSRIVA